MPWTPVDVKPYTPVAQPVWSGHDGVYPLETVAAVAGMTPSFVGKVAGKSKSATLCPDDVRLLLEQDAYHETFVPRSRILDYLEAQSDRPKLTSLSLEDCTDRMVVGSSRDVLDAMPNGIYQPCARPVHGFGYDGGCGHPPRQAVDGYRHLPHLCEGGRAEHQNSQRSAFLNMSRQVSGSDMSRWQTFTDMVRAAAEPLTKVDHITMYGDGNSTKLVGDTVNSVSQLSEGLSQSLGIDLKALLNSMVAGHAAGSALGGKGSEQSGN